MRAKKPGQVAEDAHFKARLEGLSERGAWANAAKAIIELCAEVCRKERNEFLHPNYAANQPIDSFPERFACDQCEKAILALIPNGGAA